MEKGRILQKTIAVILVLCMTAANFILAATNTVYALTEVDGNIIFDASFKNEKANVSDGENLYINLELKAGELQEGKIKIDNANFKIEADKIKSKYVSNVDTQNNEIVLNKITYNDGAIEIVVPVSFEKAEKIETTYFDRENSISLSGTYRNGENGKEIKTEAIKTNLKWTQGLNGEEKQIGRASKASIEKIITLGNKTIIQAVLSNEYTKNYFPKETEKIAISFPKINNTMPTSYKVLVNGNKINDEKIQTAMQTFEEDGNNLLLDAITFTNEYIDGNYIKWTEAGDTYKVIFEYEGITEINNADAIRLQSETKLYNRDNTSKSKVMKLTIGSPKGTVASVEATGTPDGVYKGFMYANSNETTFEEKYNLEISDAKDLTSKLELAQSNFKNNDGASIETNNQVYYKEIKLDKESLENVIGAKGRLKVTLYGVDNKKDTIEINKETIKDEENILIKSNTVKEPLNIDIETINVENEGTIKITAQKAIKGSAGQNKESVKKLQQIQTLAKATTNKSDKSSESVAETELKETKSEATLTMSNNNILSTSGVNNIEFVAKLKTGTIDSDLVKNPTLEITLPDEVESIVVKDARVLHAEGVLEETPNTEVVDGRKIIVRISGEQNEYNNAVTQGINVLINAEIKLNDIAIARKDATINMIYTNEYSTETYTTSIKNVSIQSNYGIITNTALQTKFESEKRGKQTIATILLNNYEEAVENLALIGTIPDLELTQNVFEKTIKESFIIGESNTKTSNKVDKLLIQYSKDKENWSTDKENATFYKIAITGDNYKESLEKGERVLIRYSIDTNITIPAYWYEYEINGIKDIQPLKIDRQNDVQPEGKTEQNEENTNDVNGTFTVNMVAESGSGEVKDGDDVQEGQVIRYTYTIKNSTDKDISNVKLVANHENANVFEDVTVQDMDTENPSQKLNYTYERECEKSNTEYNVGTIKAGKIKKVTYQIRVKEDVQTIKMDAKISGNDIEEIKLTSKNNVTTSKLKLSIANGEAKEFPLTVGEVFANYLSIKNISEETLNNIQVRITIPSEFSAYDIEEFIYANNFELIQNKNNNVVFQIKQLAPGASKEILLSLKVLEDKPKNPSVRLNYTANIENKVYYSNELELILTEPAISKIEAEQSTNVNKETLKTGDQVTYKIRVKNIGENPDRFTIQDTVPTGAVVKKVYYTIKDETTEIKDYVGNTINVAVGLESNEEVNLYIETEINDELTLEEEITNYANIAGFYLENSVTTNKITYKLERNIKKQEENNKKEDDSKSNTSVISKQNISGLAWVDENKNGIREQTEKTISGMKVTLVNTETGKFVTDSDGNRLETTTNDEGKYQFEKISDGKYIVIFTYDNVKYRHTEYKVNSATEKTNSDIITSKISKTNEEIKYAITDTLKLNGKNLENIDAGFIENELFDLNLNKYITKITLQNTSGTVVKQYNKEKLAKVEIDSKNLAGTKVLIEYTMQITNDGEIAGYANEIVDYLPKDLTFDSSMNKNWYLSTDGYLHTNILSKELINPGETKEITLILVKTMTDSNVGLTSNEAEIVNYSNDLSILDKDKTNTSNAEMIISIRTGIGVTIGIVITLIAITATGVIVYTKKRKEAIHE
ncbi:MAG: hypothetical protein IKF38_03295 [Clostridia bacterium]|nr:hypothetical protein [Clostridia bacterium]